MDQITLVDRRINDGQKLVLQLAHDGFDLTAAFWLRAADDSWWHLYVATKLVDEQGSAGAYRKVQAALRQLPGTTLSLSDVKVIGSTDPLTHDILKIRRRYTGTAPIRFGGAPLGGTLVEEALNYPPVPERNASIVQPGEESAQDGRAANGESGHCRRPVVPPGSPCPGTDRGLGNKS